MKRVFLLEELDCAHCAAKMEEAIQKMDGVQFASINFMAQKLTLEADDGAFDRIVKDAAKAVKRVNRHCRLVTE